MTIWLNRYFSSSRLMSPSYKMAMSPRIDDKGNIYQVDYMDKQTPRHGNSAGKHAYAQAFGSSELSKILINNKGSKNPLEGLIKRTLQPGEDAGSRILTVPKDFMIKTAYVRKRRQADDVQSTRSRTSAVTVFSKTSQNLANGYSSVPSALQYAYPIPMSPTLYNPAQQPNNSQAFVQRFKQKIPDVPMPKIQRLNEDVSSSAATALQMASRKPA